jgi:hypothetical protein
VPTRPLAAQYHPNPQQIRDGPSQVLAPVPVSISMPQSLISVRYLEASPIQVRGLVSGVSYTFSGSQPVQQVDARDASSLLNTRLFRSAS